MSKKRDIHVVPHNKGWAARRENAKRVSSLHPTQKAAIDHARELAKRDHVEVVTHNRQGQIRDSDSYGNDPCPPRDKKH